MVVYVEEQQQLTSPLPVFLLVAVGDWRLALLAVEDGGMID
jgi:hypothetical protein